MRLVDALAVRRSSLGPGRSAVKGCCGGRPCRTRTAALPTRSGKSSLSNPVTAWSAESARSRYSTLTSRVARAALGPLDDLTHALAELRIPATLVDRGGQGVLDGLVHALALHPGERSSAASSSGSRTVMFFVRWHDTAFSPDPRTMGGTDVPRCFSQVQNRSPAQPIHTDLRCS